MDQHQSVKAAALTMALAIVTYHLTDGVASLPFVGMTLAFMINANICLCKGK